MTISNPSITATQKIPLIHVYVWQWPVRVTHWLNGISIWVLSVTGIYIGFPSLIAAGSATDLFIMGWAKLIHFYAAIVFVLSVISRLIWMFVGNRYASWDKFIPVREKRFRGLWPTLKYYFFAMRTPPGFIGHNPLAGITYSFVYLAFILQILTGLAMYGASAHVDSPVRIFASLAPLLGGLQTARFIHHVIMWLIWCFFVHHVYSAIVMSQVEGNGTVESIVSGWKFVPPEDVVFSGYRFKEHQKEKEDKSG